ncbi:efflux RND transporter periplasmic adaptor subunit [Neotabrizicola sp. VNH66]|uniref:efflux RND transporter periplasmic adaptor subunit n=1 Tax=Neotabrizicola sp. VNH66 TaxID=3400918 RepID=UPI003C0C30CB
MRAILTLVLTLWTAALPVSAEVVVLHPVTVTDWKAVFGRVEARDSLPARARLGGTLTELTVKEGDEVAAGDVLGRIVDDKLTFQLSAYDAQIAGLEAQRANAQTELQRGEDLLARGVTTAQQLDALRTQVSVLVGQIAAVQAERRGIEQQATEGIVLAPVAGRVIAVPVARGAVVMAGETVAMIAGGGIYLRLAVPERHAAALEEGDEIRIEEAGTTRSGRVERVYPLIENGRVLADVAVPGLSDRFIDARVLVRLPVAERAALMLPAAAILTRSGLDFVALEGEGGPTLRAVVVSAPQEVEGVATVEVLSGLAAGDRVVLTPTEGGNHD